MRMPFSWYVMAIGLIVGSWGCSSEKAVAERSAVSESAAAEVSRRDAVASCDAEALGFGDFLEPPTIELARSVASAKPSPENRTFMLPGDIPLEMVGIGEGTFVMGSPMPEQTFWDPNAYTANRSMGHKVTLTKPFWIGRYEITQQQYEAFPGNGRAFFPKGERMPAVGVSWNEARAFTQKLNDSLKDELPEGYRFDLPTEAQWEYACRAGTISTYNNGKMGEYERSVSQRTGKPIILAAKVSPGLDEVGWYIGNTKGIQEVGRKRPNAWGIYDMHGNASEWCLDFYVPDYGGRGEIPVLKSSKIKFVFNMIDPVVLTQEGLDTIVPKGFIEIYRDAHIVRGGGAFAYPETSSSYYRSSLKADTKVGVGFRVALVRFSPPQIDTADCRCFGSDNSQRHLAELARKRMEHENALRARREEFNRKILVQREEQRARIERELFWSNLSAAVHSILDVVVEAAIDGATDAAIQRINSRHSKKSRRASGSSSSSGGAAGGETGFGTIKGPSSLSYDTAHNNGQWARYSLYVGGKNVSDNASWSSAGTSITVNSNGRAMAGNPPVDKGRSFKTGIRATYNGKSYTKSITIMKH